MLGNAERMRGVDYMPLCLNCGYNICFYTDDPDAHFIEECWCGGYIVERDLISDIIRKDKSLRKTMRLLNLDNRLGKDEERLMVDYAITSALLENVTLNKYLQTKSKNGTEYLMKIVKYTLENTRK
jgi:hypothetical protein